MRAVRADVDEERAVASQGLDQDRAAPRQRLRWPDLAGLGWPWDRLTAKASPVGRDGSTPPATGAGALPPRVEIRVKRWGRRRAAEPLDDSLYGVLGVRPGAADWEIQVAYRRRAAALAQRQVPHRTDLRELNAAYEVLGNPARRAEYDRQRALPPALEPPPDAVSVRYPHLRRAHREQRSGGGGLAELAGVTLVLGLSVLAAVVFLSRFTPDLSPVASLARQLGLGQAERPTASAATVTVGDVPLAAPSAPSPSPGGSPALPLARQFEGSTVTPSATSPRPNTTVTLVVKLRRNGQPAANVDTWAVAQYRTTRERNPATGAIKTDATGTAAIPVNLGNATPGFEIKITVFGLVEGQELSWPTSVTPR